MLRVVTLIACLGTGLASAAVELDRVPASHRWVLHVDVQQALQGELGRWVEDILADPTTAARIRLLQTLTGIDPRQDLHGITISGVDNQEDQAVAVISGRFDPERIETLATAAEGHRVIPHGDHRIHHWLDAKQDPPKPQYGCLVGEGLLLFAGDPAAIGRTLDTIVGQGASLAEDPAFADLEQIEAAIVVGGATGLDTWRDLKPRAAMLREVESLRLVLDQVAADLRLDLSVTAKAEDKAQQLQQVVQGLIALYGLGRQQEVDPAVQQFIQGLQVERDGTTVRLTTALPVAEVRRLAAQHRAQQDGAASP